LSSNATAWALYALSRDLDVQAKLRDELLSVSTDSPTMDDMNGLPYLDAVVREALRVHAPVPATVRIAMKDDVIPLDTPFVDKNGVLRGSIRYSMGC
jgi:cytochrome P450